MGDWIGHEYRGRGPILVAIVFRLFEGGGINQPAHGRHTISRNAQTPGVLADTVFVRRQVYTIDFVFRDVAVKPLNLRAHLVQGFQRAERQFANLNLAKGPGSRDLPFDHELRHTPSSVALPDDNTAEY
jgi:hypothetical protein